MSSLDDIVTIVEFHRRRWKPPASLTISLTKSLRVAGSLALGLGLRVWFGTNPSQLLRGEEGLDFMKFSVYLLI